MSSSANDALMSVNGVVPVGQPARAGPAGAGAAGVAEAVAEAVLVPTLLIAKTRSRGVCGSSTAGRHVTGLNWCRNPVLS